MIDREQIRLDFELDYFVLLALVKLHRGVLIVNVLDNQNYGVSG